MKLTPKITIAVTTLALLFSACSREISSPEALATPGPAPTTAPAAPMPITLPVLDALLTDGKFKADLKSKLQLTDDQVAALQKLSSEEVARLRRTNAESQSGDAETARQKADDAFRSILGPAKTDQLLALARDRWSKGGESSETAAAQEPTMLKGPNAVPTDTRIVVNIPAFRMDLFQDGSLVKSYKIGIGYPQFPLPQGLRKAETIIFNPTWTPPDSPWVNSMNVTPGEVIPAGSAQNPLGPIKIPIGAPSLIHGGKPLYKIGTFASHGCVGLTNSQVKDFARFLAQASNTTLNESTMAAYLKNRTRTRVVKLGNLVPVELRYETIVIQNGQLHIYRDVYVQNTNTEENLRAVLAANGTNLDSLNVEEKVKVLEALNAMSLRPKKQPSPTATPTQNSNVTLTAAERKAEAERQRKLRSQKEIVIDLSGLAGKGYPVPVSLDSGTGTNSAATSVAANKP